MGIFSKKKKDEGKKADEKKSVVADIAKEEKKIQKKVSKVKGIKEAKAYLKRVVTDLKDDDTLKAELQAFLFMDHFTPETLSAAYARISRNPAPIPELRDKARKEVDKARRSNQAIIFGLGHSSVAEHAVFKRRKRY